MVASLLLVVASIQAGELPRTTADCQATGPSASAVRLVAERIIAADNRRDIAAVMALYSQAAWLLPPMEPPVQGHDNIRPRYERLFAGFSPAIDGHIDDVCVSGTIGVVRGHNRGSMRGLNGQPSRTVDDVYLMVVTRERDEQWRISQLIWHPPSKVNQ
jgi:uncharacterized protein (TIGR02246 family)